MAYSIGFKTRMIQRISGPDAISARELAEQVGVPKGTLYRWLGEFAIRNEAKRNEQVTQKRPVVRSPIEKLRLVMEASALSQDELGEFLRRNGIHEAQLEEWRQSALSALAPPKVGRRRKSPEAKRVEQLERELNRKDKALAEVTALLALKKKLEILLGDEDESTTPRSER